MRPVFLTKSLAAAASNNICLSQTPGGAGNLTINGAAAVAGVATLDTQRVVGITGAANDSARTFTVFGTDDNGNSISEIVTPGPNVSTVSTVNNFKTVTRIAVDAATAGAITVGTTGVGSSKPVPLDQYISPFNPTLAVEVTGTLNYDVQYTNDDVFDPAQVSSLNWFSVTALTAQTTNKDSSLITPVAAVRLKINSGSGSGKLIVRQPGIGGL